MTGVDARVGPALAAARRLAEAGLLAADGVNLRAHVRRTAKGGLYIAAGDRGPQRLVAVSQTHESIRGAAAGATIRLAQDNRAPAVTAWGSTRAGRGGTEIIIAAVAPGTPLRLIAEPIRGGEARTVEVRY